MTGVRVEPEMVQIFGVVLPKLTLNPLVAVAVNVVAPAPGEIDGGASNVIVCGLFNILMLFLTSRAGE